ncbi:hypothetical protein D3C75_606850 [compost metagenome]
MVVVPSNWVPVLGTLNNRRRLGVNQFDWVKRLNIRNITSDTDLASGYASNCDRTAVYGGESRDLSPTQTIFFFDDNPLHCMRNHSKTAGTVRHRGHCRHIEDKRLSTSVEDHVTTVEVLTSRWQIDPTCLLIQRDLIETLVVSWTFLYVREL